MSTTSNVPLTIIFPDSFIILSLYRWEGKDENEVGICTKTGKTLVKVDARYYRPTEVELLHGNPKKAQDSLGWKRKVDFPSLVEEMVLADLASIKNPSASED
jgi:GDPmannose 4,6-dehydratase